MQNQTISLPPKVRFACYLVAAVITGALTAATTVKWLDVSYLTAWASFVGIVAPLYAAGNVPAAGDATDVPPAPVADDPDAAQPPTA